MTFVPTGRVSGVAFSSSQKNSRLFSLSSDIEANYGCVVEMFCNNTIDL